MLEVDDQQEIELYVVHPLSVEVVKPRLLLCDFISAKHKTSHFLPCVLYIWSLYISREYLMLASVMEDPLTQVVASHCSATTDATGQPYHLASPALKWNSYIQP